MLPSLLCKEDESFCFFLQKDALCWLSPGGASG
jgi:hypothetical protein